MGLLDETIDGRDFAVLGWILLQDAKYALAVWAAQ